MQDPNFMHTVVLICQHDENGAFGLTVNRPTSAIVSDAFPSHPVLGISGLTLRSGGPVSPDALQFLHRLPLADADSVGAEVAPDVWLGADLGAVAQYLDGTHEGAADSVVRFVVGYSGWGEGQLDAEMATGSWLPVPATADLVFSPDSGEAVWRAALARIPGGGASLAQLPPDPTWN